MNLSTFNSESEWKVWAVVFAVLVTAEIVLRNLLPYLSLDIVHIQQIPNRVEHLSSSQGTRILFLGNSITRNGIDIKQFEKHLSSNRPVTVEEIYPDDTAIAEWLYAYLHFLVLPQKEIDELIICFAEDQLQDRLSLDVRRLAANYSDWDTMLTIFQEEKLTPDQKAEFVLARLWVSYANAERVQKRLLDYLIPYYRQTAGIINSSLTKSAKHDTTSVATSPTYHRLQRLIDVLNSRDVNLMVFALPVGKDYKLDPKLERILEANDFSFSDVRALPGITADNFPDGYHMDQSAAQIMATTVAKQVSQHLKTSNP